MTAKKHLIRMAIIGSVLLAVAIGWCGWAFLVRSDYRKALPPTATDIHEKRIDMFPDYTLFLKARMAREDYDAYVKKVGLGPPLKIQTNSPWEMWAEGDGWGAKPPAWWNPTSADPGSVGASSGRANTLAQYENGYLYLVNFKY